MDVIWYILLCTGINDKSLKKPWPLHTWVWESFLGKFKNSGISITKKKINITKNKKKNIITFFLIKFNLVSSANMSNRPWYSLSHSFIKKIKWHVSPSCRDSKLTSNDQIFSRDSWTAAAFSRSKLNSWCCTRKEKKIGFKTWLIFRLTNSIAKNVWKKGRNLNST